MTSKKNAKTQVKPALKAKKKTIQPTTNLFIFNSKDKNNQIIVGDNNYMAGGEMNINNSKDFEIQSLKKQVGILKKQIIKKDKIIKKLVELI